MKKVIKLTEVDLQKMVKKIIKESEEMDYNLNPIQNIFSNSELTEIKERVIRLLSPGFFEDYEVVNYINQVSNNDKKVERMLVDWLKSEGIEFYQPEYRSGGKERDYDYIDDLLGNYGLHPNWGWYEEFENSNYYDPNMSDDEYAESIYDFISKGE